MLEVKNIDFSYGKKEILKDISFSASKGQVISIIGPNGSGKTTLLKCINKINTPTNGEIFIDGDDILKIKVEKISKKIAYVPQMLNESFDVNVTEVIMMGRRPYISWAITDRDIDIVANVMKDMEIEHLAEKSFSELSGGQKQKVLISRALVQEAPVFLFDEPTSFLDIKNQLEVLSKAREFAKENEKVIILVVHDLNMVMAYSDKILLMNDKKVISFNSPDKVLTEENIKDVYGIDVCIRDNHIFPKYN